MRAGTGCSGISPSRALRLSCVSLFAAALLLAACTTSGSQPEAKPGAASSPISTPDGQVTTYVGSTPAGAEILSALGLDRAGPPELIEWTLALQGSERSGRFDLRLVYGRAAQGSPGLASGPAQDRRQGTWTSATLPDITGRVLRLSDAVDLVQMSPDVLHVLNSERDLMVGDGGWSYTLNREASAEPIPAAGVVSSQPDMSYRILPLSTGAETFGVFEGRTPCQGIAGLIAIEPPENCVKVKWRITLNQDAQTSRPTSYRIEGSLHRQKAREGTWSRIRGTADDPKASVIRLGAAAGESELDLLVGDDGVLFVLDESGKPLVGHALYSYSLNRRASG